jgi:hypothetical protein
METNVGKNATSAGNGANTPEPPAADAAAAIDERPVLQVVAPAGPRRRAGLAFGKEPRQLTAADLGATDEEREARMKALLADPLLSVSPITPADRD